MHFALCQGSSRIDRPTWSAWSGLRCYMICRLSQCMSKAIKFAYNYGHIQRNLISSIPQIFHWLARIFWFYKWWHNAHFATRYIPRFTTTEQHEFHVTVSQSSDIRLIDKSCLTASFALWGTQAVHITLTSTLALPKEIRCYKFPIRFKNIHYKTLALFIVFFKLFRRSRCRVFTLLFGFNLYSSIIIWFKKSFWEVGCRY